ncbi:hypothetical protein RhiJN_01939 [Ceratobasidium sp. AG-Ba]|nr:hypothetical protein RhiJN_01939 [Ceratobasidium sp. AG-Ba]QRW02872.1 hypothetical protein RhiLY_01871 [Ceratobasidium sp. AG-Ba]
MNPPGLPNRSIKLYTNINPLELPLPIAFNQRLDVIVAEDAGGERLGAQVAKYALVSGVRLGDLFEDEFGLNPDMQVMTLRDEREGAWFIDGRRGKLTLHVPKERYKTIGIVGEQEGGMYVIDVDLRAKTSSGFARAKSVLGKWDKAWDVWVLGAEDAFKGRTRLPKQATAEALVLEDVLVPTTLPGGRAEDEAWVELFEWS